MESLAAQLAQQEHDSSLSARFDSLRVLWYRRIVNFDSRTQVELLEQVKTFTLDSSSMLRTKFDELSKRLKAWLGRPWNLVRVAKITGLLAGAGALIWFLIQLARGLWLRWRQWRRPQEFDPVRRTAGRWLARLHPHQGHDEVLSDLRRLRYGRRESWPEPRGVFKRAKDAARRGPRSAPRS